MPKHAKKYTNNIAESNTLRVYTFKDNSQIRVFFKTVNGEFDRVFSGQKVMEFLNCATNIKGHKNKFAISKNVEQGIIKDIKGIRRRNGRYIIQNLSPDKQYEELFKSEQAIQFDLNGFMSDSISKSVHLKDRFEEILDFDPEEGLCHPLNYFIVLVGLKNKEDFIKLLRFDSAVSEQDFIAYIIDKSEKQAPKLLAIQMLLQCLPIFDVQSIDKREGYPFYTNEVIYEQSCEDLSFIRRQVHIDQERVKRVLNDIRTGHYLEFNFSCYTYNKKGNTDNTHYSSDEESDSGDSIDSNDYNEGTAHSILVYKAENSKYVFFDSNKGAIGFCPNTGIANLTPEETCEAVELAVNSYSYDKYIENSPIFPDGCEIFITLRNATLMLEKAEKFYETTKGISSKIIDISVNKQTNNTKSHY